MKWWEKNPAEIANENVSAQLRSVSFRVKESEDSLPARQQQQQQQLEEGSSSSRKAEDSIELEKVTGENAAASSRQNVQVPSPGKTEETQSAGQDVLGRGRFGENPVFTVNLKPQTGQLNGNADPVAEGVKLPLEYSSTSTLCSNPQNIHAGSPQIRRKNFIDNLSLISMSLGLGNIWRLPALIFTTYPGETLIAYLILMTVVGLPLLLLEMTVAQFSSSPVVNTWQAVPLLKGIGVAQLVSGFYVSLYYPGLMAWAFQFGVSGIGRWQNCHGFANLTTCLCKTDCEETGNLTVAEMCFQKEVLHSDSDSMNAKLLPMLAVAIIMIAICSSWGHRRMKVFLSCSGLLTAILLCAALALALTYPVNPDNPENNNTAIYGIQMLNPRELWAFGTGEVWYGAMVQVVFSLCVGFGVVPSVCSDRNFRDNVVRNAVLVWFFNVVFAIISVLTIFAWAGIAGLGNAVVLDHTHFVYLIYYHVSDSMWAGLAFALIFFAGLNSMIPQFFAMVHSLSESFPTFKAFKWQGSIVLAVILWLLNIPAIIQVGNEVVTMWDHFGAGSSVLSCLIVHMIGWAWIYRSSRLQKDMEFMIQRRVNSIWSTAWATIVILLLTVAELWGFFGLPLDGSRTCKYPIWLTAAGWSMYLLALVIAVLIVLLVIVQQVDYGIKAKILSSLKPLRTWGPRDPLLNHNWKQGTQINGDSDLNLSGLTKTVNVQSVIEESLAADSMRNTMRKRTSISIVRVPSTRDYTQNSFVQIQ